MTEQANVTIYVTDVNDNRPYWLCDDRPPDEPYIEHHPCFYNEELRSDTLVGFQFMQVYADDVDEVSSELKSE